VVLVAIGVRADVDIGIDVDVGIADRVGFRIADRVGLVVFGIRVDTGVGGVGHGIEEDAADI